MVDNKEVAQVDSKVVATQFIQYYYKELLNGPQNVLKCYSVNSSIKRFGRELVSGLENIKAELEQYHVTNVKIYKINSVYSIKDSVFLQVGAEIATETKPERTPVIHNVLLVPRGPLSFYIHSDLLDFVDNLFDDGKPKPVKAPAKYENQTKVEKPVQNGVSSIEKTQSPVKPVQQVPPSLAQPVTPSAPLQNGTHEKIDQVGFLQSLEAHVPSLTRPTQQTQLPPTQPRTETKPFEQPPLKTGPATWAQLVGGGASRNGGLASPTKPIEPPKPVGFQNKKPQEQKTQQQQQSQPKQRRDDKTEKNPRRLHFSYLRRKQQTGQPVLEEIIKQAFSHLGNVEKVNAFGSDKWVNGYVEFEKECSVQTAISMVDNNTGKPGLQLRIAIPVWELDEHVQISETPRISNGSRGFNNRTGQSHQQNSNNGWNNVGRRDNRQFRPKFENQTAQAR
ncbi:unnamed protein product [Bursaphelenchus okinawaensis]|uniref:NTF2 domain-containing protein n=1 Tax=Bursaphelenchus okinawaensis TaxID=465554 RepID=A0A811KUK7_9BILA|nr:unnamed protein product [Bursaphelenchus okinawaensis]CAG9112158.1 unnamed protein product [Bursaphelenchus okinawaensis]